MELYLDGDMFVWHLTFTSRTYNRINHPLDRGSIIHWTENQSSMEQRINHPLDKKIIHPLEKRSPFSGCDPSGSHGKPPSSTSVCT